MDVQLLLWVVFPLVVGLVLGRLSDHSFGYYAVYYASVLIGWYFAIHGGYRPLWAARGSYSVAWQASAAGIFLGAVLLGKKWKSASRDNQAEINDGSDR